jgi:hypothetical protein
MFQIETTLKLFITTTCFLLMAVYCNAQFNIHKQKLNTTIIDTTKESVFIYEAKNVIIYFRQSDVKRIILINENDNARLPGRFYKLKDTLNSGGKKIRVNDILYSFDQHERDSIMALKRTTPDEITLNEEFYFIGGALLLNGSFMLYSKHKNQIISRHLIAKRQKGLMGGADLIFCLPCGEVFYTVNISLGD